MNKLNSWLLIEFQLTFNILILIFKTMLLSDSWRFPQIDDASSKSSMRIIHVMWMNALINIQNINFFTNFILIGWICITMDASLTLTLSHRIIRKKRNEKSLQSQLKNLLQTPNHHLHSSSWQNHRYRETNHDKRNSQKSKKASSGRKEYLMLRKTTQPNPSESISQAATRFTPHLLI
jgi:hypothetical protein